MAIQNFAIYPKDGNCYITKFVPCEGQVTLVRCIGELKGPYGVNKVVAPFDREVAFALPKLTELNSMTPGCFYALKATGVITKGKYTVFGFDVEKINLEQYERMLDIVEYTPMLEGIFEFSGSANRLQNMVEDPLPSTSSSVPTSSEYMDFKELYQVFKKIGSSVKYHSEDHYVLVHQYKHRINETKAGYRRSDVQAVVNKIVGE